MSVDYETVCKGLLREIMKLAFGELIVHCPCKANLVQHPAPLDVMVVQTKRLVVWVYVCGFAEWTVTPYQRKPRFHACKPRVKVSGQVLKDGDICAWQM